MKTGITFLETTRVLPLRYCRIQKKNRLFVRKHSVEFFIGQHQTNIHVAKVGITHARPDQIRRSPERIEERTAGHVKPEKLRHLEPANSALASRFSVHIRLRRL